jgi:type II secretory pathway predicted ATPase ExeA
VYEGFFGLSKRPFSAVPNSESFIGLAPVRESLDALLTCVTQSRGIAVVTSAAGLGKTLLCKRLADVAKSRFQALYLSTSSFSTRRALLQAILYEFGVEYEGLTEQEARLKILEAARAIASEGRILLVIVDEAHLLNARLFEELRTLTDYAPEGDTLIRLVLSGHFELEEKLTDPSMSAFNQRIGCQICLEPLTLEQSAELIIERLFWAGAADIETILTEPALEAICRAGDGNPRCLCQLADHSFLLAFAEEQKPVERATVVAALDDLKELPLHWNDLPDENFVVETVTFPEIPQTEETDSQDISAENELKLADRLSIIEEQMTEEIHARDDVSGFHVLAEELQLEPELEETKIFSQPDEAPVEYAVIEVGAGIDSDVSSEEEEVESSSIEFTESKEPVISLPISLEEAAYEPEITDELVVDKYAELDRAAELQPETDITTEPQNEIGEDVETPTFESVDFGDFACEQEILETIEELRREIGSAVDDSKKRIASEQLDDDFEANCERDIVEPEPHPDVKNEPQAPIDAELSFDSEPPHQFAQLFTRLRQRRRQIQQRQAQ